MMKRSRLEFWKDIVKLLNFILHKEQIWEIRMRKSSFSFSIFPFLLFNEERGFLKDKSFFTGSEFYIFFWQWKGECIVFQITFFKEFGIFLREKIILWIGKSSKYWMSFVQNSQIKGNDNSLLFILSLIWNSLPFIIGWCQKSQKERRSN